VSTQKDSLGIQSTAAAGTSNEAESKTANIILTFLYFILFIWTVFQNSSVGKATRYRLEGPGIESQ
jgi:hypothetical protein